MMMYACLTMNRQYAPLADSRKSMKRGETSNAFHHKTIGPSFGERQVEHILRRNKIRTPGAPKGAVCRCVIIGGL
jgi:hypothetical protein